MNDEPSSGVTKGYKVVPGGGQAKPSAPGTEQANEGKGSATPWAKRKSNTSTTDEGGY